MSQSRRAEGDSLPQIAAVGFDVVGRRTPTWATSAPDSTLNRLDLPLPVAPAKATTVRPPASEVRITVLAMAASARATPSRGRQPAPDSRADVNAAALACSVAGVTPATASTDGSVFESVWDPRSCGLIALLQNSSSGLDISRSSLDPIGLPRADRQAGNGRVQSCLLAGIQLERPDHQLAPSPGGKPANCLVTEDGLQDALGQDRRTTR